MHDAVDLESRGIPTVIVASRPFTDAAAAQARSLGMPAVARVITEHPVQDRTDDEIRTYADQVFDALLAGLLATP